MSVTANRHTTPHNVLLFKILSPFLVVLVFSALFSSFLKTQRREFHFLQPNAQGSASRDETMTRPVVHREVADRDGHLAAFEFVAEMASSCASWFWFVFSCGS
jgi:hypothetical protein